MIRKLVISLSAFASVFCVSAQNTDAGADTLQRHIEEVTVRGGLPYSVMQMRGQGEMQLDMTLMDDLPKILGNADPMHYAQTLPGVQTNNEYDGGLHILGCDNSHNLIGIDGVPIYNASHLLGIFSVFNPTHFLQMSIRKAANRADFPNRLGGMVNMTGSHAPHEQPDKSTASYSMGLISSQGTLKIPVRNRSVITLSGRGCYLNKLYGYALKADESELGYTFGDANATWLFAPDSMNTMWFEAYWGGDRATMQENSYQADSRLRWGSTMLALHWQHSFPQSFHQTFYYTESHSCLGMDQQVQLKMSAGIRDLGYKGYWQERWGDAGVDAALHSVLPLMPIIGEKKTDTDRLLSKELSVYADGNVPLGNSFLLVMGLRLTTFFTHESKNYYAADPSVTCRYAAKRWNVTLSVSTRHQHVWQTGFSSMGLPTESWMAADGRHRPLAGLSLMASAGRSLFGERMHLQVELFAKRLRHLWEYDGSLLDMLYDGGSAYALSLQGKGRTYGANITIEQTRGKLTGWLSYNIGRSQRCYDENDAVRWYAANHDRTHELNIVAAYHAGKRWSFGGTFVAASGTPFTMPENVYLYSRQVLAQFSEHNAYRLKSYQRLDLSANYLLSSNGNKEHGLNVSVYNALGRRNELFYSWHVSRNGDVAFRPVSFLLKVIPSVSYYAKF